MKIKRATLVSQNVDMKLEAIVIPASDADRSKDLYLLLGGVSTPISALRTDSEWFSSLLKNQELRFSIITDG